MFYETFEERYQALKLRDPAAEGHFVYCVVSTNIVCRPTCSSRLPLAKNIVFCDTLREALAKHFRPCKRCKPDVIQGWNRTRECTAAGCVLIAASARQKTRLDVAAVAKKVGLSKWHFCRAFKNYTGTTPRKFYLRCADGADLLKVVLPLVLTKKALQRKRQMGGSEPTNTESLGDLQDNPVSLQVEEESPLGTESELEVMSACWRDSLAGLEMCEKGNVFTREHTSETDISEPREYDSIFKEFDLSCVDDLNFLVPYLESMETELWWSHIFDVSGVGVSHG